MDELYKKLELILKTKFPNEMERDDLMAKAGEIILTESLNIIMEKMPGDRERQKLSSMIKNGDIGESFDYAEKNGVKMEEIFEDRAKSVVMDLFG